MTAPDPDQQFGPYDERVWTAGTGMPLDLLAIQALYGAPTSISLSGGQVFGFHTNAGDLLQTDFDVTIDTNPVVTLHDTGGNGTLDLPGYTTAETVNPMHDSFSSVAGTTNNLATTYGTGIDTALGGSGSDPLVSNLHANVLTGGGGTDTVQGTVASLSSDPITDLSAGEKTTFVDATPANFPVNDGGTTLTHTDESLTSSNHPDGQFITTADAIYGGVDMAPTPAIPADILLETFSGEVKIWTMNGLNFNGAIQLITPGNGWFVITKGDFNGDGHADLLWQNLFSGQPAIWTTSNLAVTGGAALSNPGTAWNVVDAADFNGDGKADILWQNDNGQPAIWTVNGLTATGGAALSNPGPSWNVMGAADFNGDGKADILWQNDNGQPAIWTMDGLTVTGGAGLSNPGPAWHVIDAADFNGDGKADILWQNDNGQPAIWLMNGFTVTGGAGLTNPGPAWHAVGTADVNRDGKADILWQNDSHQLAIWTMDGVTVTGGTGVGNPGSDWYLL